MLSSSKQHSPLPAGYRAKLLQRYTSTSTTSKSTNLSQRDLQPQNNERSNLAEMLASSKNCLPASTASTVKEGSKRAKQNGGTKSGESGSSGSKAFEVKRAKQATKSLPSKASHHRDRLYVGNLLEAVDKAIAIEYGSDGSSSESLTFNEIFESLQSVEKRYRQMRHASGRAGQKRPRSTICSSCSNKSKQMKTLVSDFGTEGEQSERDGGAGGSGVNLLLSRSEERLLLSDLEREAHRMAVSFVSYLTRAGEGISSILCREIAT